MIRTWKINFEFIGPISVKSPLSFKQEKGFSLQQFYSDIKISSAIYGINVTVTAYADNIRDAEIAAHVFLGRMRDVLSTIIDLPIQINRNEGILSLKTRFKSKILLEKEDFISAFNKARIYEIHEPKLLQAMGWYSKAKLSTNPYDQFFSYWNAIEILGVAYHTKTERTKSGSVNKIYQSFLDYFGNQDHWPVQDTWINKFYGLRNSLYHGGTGTTLEDIIKISSEIHSISSISSKYIQQIMHKIDINI